MDRVERIRPRPRMGWLAAVVPESARRFRVRDQEFAAALSAAGAELVETAPDVEIAGPDEIVGDAGLAIVPVDGRPRQRGRSRPARAAQRVLDAALVARRSAAARRAALRRGYTEAMSVTWEPHARLRPSLDDAPEAPLFQRAPRHAIALCWRRQRELTALEAACSAAANQLGRPLELHALVLGSSGVVVAPSEEVVLRVSLGPAARRIQEQAAALELLRGGNPSAVVAERVPWIVARGTAGLALWSVEQRLPGDTANVLPEGILGQVLDFLVELFAAGAGGGTPASPASDAATCAEHFTEHRAAFHELGRRLEDTLGDVPRGFGQGDLWRGNLLVDGDRLAGVVDWPSAGLGRLPLLDVLHLQANQVRRADAPFASAVTNHLLPQARAGGSDLDRAYCRRLALDLGPVELVSLVGAYWLEELRHALVDPDRDPRLPRQPEWRSANLEALRAFFGAQGPNVRSV